MLMGDCFFPVSQVPGHFSGPVETQIRHADKLRAAIIVIILWIDLDDYFSLYEENIILLFVCGWLGARVVDDHKCFHF